MIVAEQKPVDEIKGFLDGTKKVLVLGCGTCVTVCLAGGEREVAALSSLLRITGLDIAENTIERQCDAEFYETVKESIEQADVVLSMACGVGVQMLGRMFPDKPVYPALNTKFMGTNDGAGRWSENCLACGDCKLGKFGGVCPVTRCSKSLLNGPCGGSSEGKCEVDPDTIECGWQLIHDRLKEIGQLDTLTQNAAANDWANTHAGGPRQLSREDIAGL